MVIGNSSFKGENLEKNRLKLTKFSMNMTAQSILFILKKFGIVLPFVCWLTNVYISHWSVNKKQLDLCFLQSTLCGMSVAFN